MMSNERPRQASTPLVVAKDNLKQTETKGYPLQNKKNKIMSTYLIIYKHTQLFGLSYLYLTKFKSVCCFIDRIQTLDSIKNQTFYFRTQHVLPFFDVE